MMNIKCAKLFIIWVFTLMVFCNAKAQLTLDTLYPGFDLQITKMDALRSEVFPGEGVRLQMTVKNQGARTADAAIIHFWVTPQDDDPLLPEYVLTTKYLMELDPLTSIDFNKLIVIPDDYKYKTAYITAEIILPQGTQPDPTPDNNSRITGIKIGDPSSYKKGRYALDAVIEKFTCSVSKKAYRNVPFQAYVTYSIRDQKMLTHDHIIHIYLSKDQVLDADDPVISSYLITKSPNNQSVDVAIPIKIGKLFAKGKVYLFARIESKKWFDTQQENNISAPISLKIK